MKVLVYNQQQDISIDRASIKPIVQEILTLEKRVTDEVAIYFISNEKMCALHQQFFQDPSPTDCISFPMDEDLSSDQYHILGEVFVCPHTAIRYLSKKKHTAGVDVYRETTLYMVHGLLHLLGYDDIEKKDRALMRVLEKKYMMHLSQKGLLLSKKTLRKRS